MMPMPPARAMATAMADSVTVSMLALTRGIRRAMLRDRRVLRSACDRLVMSEYFGTKRTSSKVSPSRNSTSFGAA